MSQPVTFRASVSTPCPVCTTHTKGCSATDDGLHFCRGVPQFGWQQLTTAPDAAGFHHYRLKDRPEHVHAPAPKQQNPAKIKVDWTARAQRYAASLRPVDREQLAASLSLPVSVLTHFPLIGTTGIDSNGATFSFPETDAAGKVIGISLRIPAADGKIEKREEPGSKRGLTIPAGWDPLGDGWVYIVEGASDTLAMRAAGLIAIGRMSATGGIELLAKFLRNVPNDRTICIVGENDRKAPGSIPEWPGKEGAEQTARTLSLELGRNVHVSLPPSESKDVRAWLTAPKRTEAWDLRGEALDSLLQSHAYLAAGNLPRPASPTLPTSTARGPKHQIFAGFNEFEVNNAAITAIATHDGTYQRGGVLTHVGWQDEQTLKNSSVRVPAGPKINVMSKATLRERLTVVADWTEQRSTSEGAPKIVASRPPDWCTSAVLDRKTWPGVPQLVSIAEFPVFLPDGTILSQPGYDPSSGLFSYPVVPVNLTVSESPTLADAKAALETIAEAVCDFPFVEDHHRSAWLAGLLTPLARYAFAGPSPMFLVEANVPGAGKGLLVNAANLIVRGDPAAVLEFSRDAEELQKVLTALLIQGESIASFDNVEGSLGGGVLNKLLTAELWEGRILGTSSTVRVPNLCTWWCTGNNVSVIGDTARRVCSIRLESPLENPEDRTDLAHEDLPAWIRANRPKLLTAALTLLRAYHRAGRPRQAIRPWGSYVQWSQLIRGAIVWAGWADPAGEGSVVRQEDDPIRGAMTVIMEGWSKIDPDRAGLTIARAIEKIGDLTSMDGKDEMQEALETLAPKNSKSRAATLGYKFREFYRRAIGRFRLDKKPVKRGMLYWFVSDLNLDLFRGGDGGHGGDTFLHSRVRPENQPSIVNGPEPSPPSPPSPPRPTDSDFDSIKDLV